MSGRKRFLLSMVMFFVWCCPRETRAMPIFSQVKSSTTTTSVALSITSLYSDPQVFRGATLAFDGTSVLTTATNVLDNGYVQNTPRSGLTPGTEYSYSYSGSSGTPVTVKMCTRPAEPVNVKATASSPTGATVTFEKNPSNGASIGRIHVSAEDSSGNAVTAATFAPAVTALTGSSTSVAVSGLTEFTQYKFKVKQMGKCDTTDPDNDLDSSEVTSATIRTGPDKPVFTVGSATDSSLILTFTSEDDLAGVSQTIERKEGSGEYSVIETLSGVLAGGDKNITDSPLTPGTQYTYQITTTDTNANAGLSATSDEVAECTLPAKVTNGAYTATVDTVTLTWTKPSGGVSGYSVAGGTAPVPAPAPDVTVDVGSLAANTKYTLQITTQFTCTSPPALLTSSTTEDVTAYTAPAKPVLTVVQPEPDKQYGITQIELSWSNPDPAVATPDMGQFKWDVYRQEGSPASTTRETVLEDGALTASATHYLLDKGLKPATVYTYTLKAYFGPSESDESDPVATCTYPSPPEEVTVVAVSDAKIKCSWTKPSGNGDQISGYAVGVNANAAPAALVTAAFEVEMDNDAGDYQDKLKLDEANVCSVTAVISACGGPSGSEFRSAEATASGYVLPLAPTVTLEVISATEIQATVTPDFTDRTPTTDGMTATLFRDGNAIATDTESPFVFDDTELEPGKLYTYAATVTTNGNPSAAATDAEECTFPADPQEVRQTAETDATVTITFSAPEGNWKKLLTYKNDVSEGTDITISPGTTEYTQEFISLAPATCFTFGVTAKADCKGDDSLLTESPTKQTVEGCTKPTATTLTVGPGNVGEVEIAFDDYTTGDFKYHLWRGDTDSTTDLKLDTSSVDDGTFTDSFQIVPGDVYCYKGAVEKNGIISDKSAAACLCATPNLVTNLAVTDRTNTTFEIGWTLPEGTVETTKITVGSESHEVDVPAASFDTGDTPDISNLDANTQYTITAESFVVCAYPAANTKILSPSASITAFTLAEQPKILAATTIDAPTEITITFTMSDGSTEPTGYGLILERSDVKIQGTIESPYVDKGLEPATSYEYTGYLVGESGIASAASVKIKFGTHPVAPVNVRQTGSTVISVDIAWDSPENEPSGYYVGFGDIPSALAETTATTGATGTTARVAEFATATEGVTAKTTNTTATIDGGTDSASLTPATEYQVGVTGCIDYTDLTDFAYLKSDNGHQDEAFEMCSPYATILVYTTPEQPKTCTVTTESATELQLTVEQSDDDVNTGTFSVQRDDLDYEFLTGLDPTDDIPHLDDKDLIPGKKYIYTVKTVYQKQESATLSCAACTMPRVPINFEGSYTSHTAIRIQWDEDEGDGFVSSYEVQLGGGSFGASSTQYSHTFTNLDPSTCYDISIKAKFDCTPTHATTPAPATYSEVKTINVCTQPAPCVVAGVNPVDIPVASYQYKIEVELTTVADHTYKIYRDGEAVMESLASTSTSNVDEIDVSGAYHCYKCTATKNNIESSLSSAAQVCSCSRPGPPIELNYKPTDTTIEVTWAAPLKNKAYTDFDFQDPEGAQTNNLLVLKKTTTGLSESTPYTFQVRTTYDCPIPGATKTFESDWASIDAFTAPAVPTLSVQEETTDSIKLQVASADSYTKIRLYKDNIEVLGTGGVAIPVASWPYTVNGLVAGTRYKFTVIVFNVKGFYAESDPVYWCTQPMPVTGLATAPRYFYGFLVTFDKPASGEFDSYEVQSEVDGNAWHSTIDSSGANQLYYYYYDLKIATDYTRTKGHVDSNLPSGTAFAEDLAHKVGSQVNDLESSTTYTVNVQVKRTCSVNRDSSHAAANKDFYSEPESDNAFTGAHPVIEIETVPLSQTSIQLSFAPFEEQADFEYKVYRYKNASDTADYTSPALSIDDIPFVDGVDKSSPALDPATLYTYEIGVIYKTQETFGKYRLKLEGEYWPGNYNDDISNEYDSDPNREGRWRPFETINTPSTTKYDPTFKNTNNDASSQHNIFHFYYREKAACTFPPSPTSVSEDLDTHTSTIINWVITDFSHAPTMIYEGKQMNVTTYLYINGELIHELKDDYDTRTFEFNDTVGATLTAKTAYTCEIDIGLTCPDDLVYFDDFEYYSTASFTSEAWSKGAKKATTFYKSTNTLMASDSTATSGRKSVKCWTRPTPVQITSVEPGDTDVGDKTSQLVIEYSTPDTGVEFEVEAVKEMDPAHASTPDAATWTSPQTETATLMNFEGLKMPGHTFNVKARSYWTDTVPGSAPKTMYSLYSPEDLDTIVYAPSPTPDPLTNNAQTLYTDRILGCTAPIPPKTVTVAGASAEAVDYVVTNPDGVLAGYQYEYTYTGAPNPAPAIAYVEPDPFAYLVEDETVTGQITSLPACKKITLDAKSVTSCGVMPVTVPSQTATTAFGYTKPLIPYFKPASSITDSNSEITIAFDHDNVDDGSCVVERYAIYRDGDSSPAKTGTTGSVKTLQDTGLTAGTTYQYQVTMTANGEESLKSDSLTICTKPNPPTNAVKRDRVDGRSLAIRWTPPAAGQATGYFITDNLLDGHTNMRTDIDSITYPMGLDYGTEYSIDISVKSYLRCAVTGDSPIRELVSDTALVTTVVIGTAPTFPVVRIARKADKDLSLSVSFSAGKIDRIELKMNEALDDPPTSDQGTFQVLDPTANKDFEFAATDNTVVAPTVYFNFTNLKIDTRYWFKITGIFDGSQSSNSRGPQASIAYIYTTPPPDNSIMGMSPPIFAVTMTAVAVVAAFLVAGIVFLFIKGAPIVVGKMSAIIAPSNAAGAGQGANPAEAEVEQPVPKDNRANQLKLQHTERQLNKELLASKIFAE